MWLLLTLLACGPPSTTGPGGAVGQVFDPIGRPFAGLAIHTTVDQTETDEDGRFRLRWEADARHLDLHWHEMAWRRDYRPEDEGQILHIALHRMKHTTLSCGFLEPCAAEVRWEVEPGLVAISRAACDPDTPPVDFAVVFDEDPTSATCTPPRGAPREASLRVTEATVWVSPPPQPVRVHLRADSGELPADCAVKVGTEVAHPEGDGWWSLTTTGVVSVSALCAGRPASPVVVHAGAQAELVWSPEGPELDDPRLPDTSEVVLLSETPPSWSIHVPASEDGRFLLPPLEAGTYRMSFGEGTLLLGARRPFVTAPGTLYVLGRIGEVVLDHDLTEGTLPVEIQ